MQDPACVCAQPLLQACMIDQCPPEFTSSLEPYCNYASQTGSPSATVSASSSLPFTIQTETSAGNNSPSPTITPSTTRSISTIPSASLSSGVVTALTSAASVASTAAATTGAGNNGAGARVGMMDIEIGLGLIGMALVGGWMAI
ncbi:hypothetical protein FRC02_011877 [Tulasnella sp. 418]|nr:hypothetical protein FRC02_011877 [Tulasnella sp. 418]